MSTLSSFSIAEEWSEFAPSWIADGLAFLRPVFGHALEGRGLGTVLLPDAIHSGRLIELLAARASWAVCLERGNAASRLVERELLRARIKNASVSTGGLEALTFADGTFDQAIWIVPPMLPLAFGEQVTEVRRTLKTGGTAVLLVIPDPGPVNPSEEQADAARLNDMVRGAEETVQAAFGATEALTYSATSQAPSMDAFLSTSFRAKQPRAADPAEVEQTLSDLKQTYDGGLMSSAPVSVVARGAIVRARKR